MCLPRPIHVLAALPALVLLSSTLVAAGPRRGTPPPQAGHLEHGMQATAPAEPSGHWEGTIQIPDHELKMTLDLARSPAGTWTGTMSIPLSTSIDVPLGELAVDATTVRFTAFLPTRASFEGKLSADAGSMSGTASNDQGSAPFQLLRNGEPHVSLPPPSSPMSKDFEGMWEGTIDVGGNTRRFGLKLASGTDGIATGTLIALDQGNQEIPFTTVTISGQQLDLESRPVSGTYRGTLGPTGEIVGEWTQRSDHRPLTFRRAGASK